MDNILEELVGEIQDEFDQEEPEIKSLPDGSIIVSGSMDVDDAVEELGLPRGDEMEEYNTLAGYVLGKLGHFPHAGESISLGKYRMEIARMDGKRIDLFRLIPQTRPEREDKN